MTFPQQPHQAPQYAGPPQPAYLPSQGAEPQRVGTAVGPHPPAYTGAAEPVAPQGTSLGKYTLVPGLPVSNGRRAVPWIVGSIAVVLLIGGGAASSVLTLAANGPTGLDDQAAITQATEQENKAAEAHDVATALKFASGGIHDTIESGGLPENTQGVQIKSVSVNNLKVTGDTAKADVTMMVTVAAEGGKTVTETDAYTYQKVDGHWTVSDVAGVPGN